MSRAPESLASCQKRLVAIREQRDACADAIRLLLDGDHMHACRYSNAPVAVCPVCFPAYIATARKTLEWPKPPAKKVRK